MQLQKYIYLGRVDGVRDEIINNWHCHFLGLGTLAVGSAVDRVEHPLSRATECQTKHYVGYHNY